MIVLASVRMGWMLLLSCVVCEKRAVRLHSGLRPDSLIIMRKAFPFLVMEFGHPHWVDIAL